MKIAFTKEQWDVLGRVLFFGEGLLRGDVRALKPLYEHGYFPGLSVFAWESLYEPLWQRALEEALQTNPYEERSSEALLQCKMYPRLQAWIGQYQSVVPESVPSVADLQHGVLPSVALVPRYVFELDMTDTTGVSFFWHVLDCYSRVLMGQMETVREFFSWFHQGSMDIDHLVKDIKKAHGLDSGSSHSIRSEAVHDDSRQSYYLETVIRSFQSYFRNQAYFEGKPLVDLDKMSLDWALHMSAGNMPYPVCDVDFLEHIEECKAEMYGPKVDVHLKSEGVSRDFVMTRDEFNYPNYYLYIMQTQARTPVFAPNLVSNIPTF